MDKNHDTYVNGFDRRIEELFAKVDRLRSENRKLRMADDLETFESEVVELTDNLASLLIGRQIQLSIDSEEMRKDRLELVKSNPRKLKNNGNEDVEIRVARGSAVKVKAVYYCRKYKSYKKNRKGLYPELFLLGIFDRMSPGLALEVSMMAAAMGSLEEARKALEERGMPLDIKTLRNVTYRQARRARLMLEEEDTGFLDTVSGCRVVASVDGGKIRLRETKPGPKTKKGRNRYHARWREVKLLHIYVVDEEGKKLRDFRPFIDGTMNGPDAVFMLMKYYLSRLGIDRADALLLVGDGARWIWNRVGGLLEQFRVKRVYELVDFYHAVEHLGKAASLRKDWKESERRRWIKKNRSLLKAGKVDKVIDAIRSICRGRNSRKLRTERDYFVHNRKRMDYALMNKLHLPMGSGAMESAIRRVVNLRLKGPSIYWEKKNAEAMILLRSFYKAGRWDLLKKLAFSCSPHAAM